MLKRKRNNEKPWKVTEHIDNALKEVPEPPEIELWDSVKKFLSTKADKILQDDYINDNVLNEKTIEEIKDEYNFDQIKGKVPPQLLVLIFLWWRQLEFFKCI